MNKIIKDLENYDGTIKNCGCHDKFKCPGCRCHHVDCKNEDFCDFPEEWDFND